MKKRILLKSQINDIFTYINNAGLNHEEFQWLFEKSSIEPYWEVPKIIHKPTNYYFKFDIKQGQLVSEYFPNDKGAIYTRKWPVWAPQFNDFIIWLDIIKGEIETPNLWEAILSEKTILEIISQDDVGNEPFDEQQQKYISLKILEIEKFLVEKQYLLNDDIGIVKSKLIYLEEASKRIGRKDWLNIVIGVSFKIALDLGLSSVHAKEFFRFIVTAFFNLLGGPNLLP